MANAVHLCLTANEADSASRMMKHLGQRYAICGNRIIDRSGSLCEGGLRSPLARSYCALFEALVDRQIIADVRHATNGPYTLGCGKFQAEIEAAIGREAQRGTAWHPPDDAQDSNDQLSLSEQSGSVPYFPDWLRTKHTTLRRHGAPTLAGTAPCKPRALFRSPRCPDLSHRGRGQSALACLRGQFRRAHP